MAQDKKIQQSNLNKDQWKAKDISRAPSTAQSGDMTDVDSQNDLGRDSSSSQANRQTRRNTDR